MQVQYVKVFTLLTLYYPCIIFKKCTFCLAWFSEVQNNIINYAAGVSNYPFYITVFCISGKIKWLCLVSFFIKLFS